MPLVQITLLEGRDSAALTRCAKEVALAVQRSLNAPLPSIRVIVQQVPPAHWIVGDRAKDEPDPASGGA